MTILGAVAAPAAALVLVLTGVVKVVGARTPPAGLVSAVGRRAGSVLCLVGLIEVVVAGSLLALPAPLPGLAAALLGVGFLGYLAYAKRSAPGSGCGCAGSEAPIGPRSYARAAWLVAAGVAAACAPVPWWQELAARPVLVTGGVLASVAVVAACSGELDDRWLLPLRRLWLRLRGHPLGGVGGPVPVAASVDLVEGSLAWRSVAHLVRSSLAEHWDTDGWRVLRYTGTAADGVGTCPVSVLFAVDALAGAADDRPVVRVAVVDVASQCVLDPESCEVPVGA